MHNYEFCSLKEYAQMLRARVKSVLPDGTVVLSDKGENLYFARLPRENRGRDGARVKSVLPEGTVVLSDKGEKLYFARLPRENRGQDSARVKSVLPEGTVVLSDKGENLYFAWLPRKNRGQDSAQESGARVDSSLECVASEEAKDCESFPDNTGECSEFAAELARIGFRCSRSNGGILLSPHAELLIEFERRFPPMGFFSRSLERFRNADSSSEFKNLNSRAGKFENMNSTGEFQDLNPQKSGDESAKIPSEEGLKLFSEGLKLIERPEPSKVKAYLRRAREFAAVGLRTGRGGGCYACARIAEELER